MFDKLCPLLAISANTTVPVICPKDACMWWDDNNAMCHMVQISNSLKRIAEDGE